MLDILKPRRYYESLVAIDPDELVAEGLSGLIIDLDNTMVPRREHRTSKGLEAWLCAAQEAGLAACIVSNNFKSRVAQVAERLDLPLVANAAKPRRRAFERGMEALKTSRDDTAVIGDQLFTDVLGGNRQNLYTILVIPLPGPELPHTAVLRRIEGWLLRRWMRHERLSLERASPGGGTGSE